jgi:succinate dehydrogenase flavin-adding protein (antitoxin of CptAB toxin-antitoxin module)
MNNPTKTGGTDHMMEARQRQTFESLLDRFDRDLEKISSKSNKALPNVATEPVITTDDHLPH